MLFRIIFPSYCRFSVIYCFDNEVEKLNMWKIIILCMIMASCVKKHMKDELFIIIYWEKNYIMLHYINNDLLCIFIQNKKKKERKDYEV